MKKYIKPVCKTARINTTSLMSGSDSNPSFNPGEKDGNWEAESKTYNHIWDNDSESEE